MNYCKLCGKPLTLTPEYDYCMECQGKQHREFTLPIDNNTVSNKTEMTPKEDFQKIKNVLKDLLGTSISQETVNVELALTELEELKRDVKRYFKLRNHSDYPFTFGSELSLELFNLREKLEKVGKEK